MFKLVFVIFLILFLFGVTQCFLIINRLPNFQSYGVQEVFENNVGDSESYWIDSQVEVDLDEPELGLESRN